DADVGEHRVENALPLRGSLASAQAVEAGFDVGGKDLQRANVELACRIFDLVKSDLHDVYPMSASANASPAATAQPSASAIRFLRGPDHGANSMTRRRTPPIRCAARSTTSPHSPSLKIGASVSLRKPSSAASPCNPSPSAQKCNGRNSASAMPE